MYICTAKCIECMQLITLISHKWVWLEDICSVIDAAMIVMPYDKIYNPRVGWEYDEKNFHTTL